MLQIIILAKYTTLTPQSIAPVNLFLRIMFLAPLHFPEVKVYLGPEGELKVNGKKKTPPYAKIWPGSAEEMTITKAGESVSFLSSTKIIKARINDEI